jgi:hypothetical protein
MKCKFRPTAQMRLKQDQLKMVAYIFREDADNKYVCFLKHDKLFSIASLKNLY